MWNRKELKNKGREVVKKSYWSIVVVCFLIALLTGEYGTSFIAKLNSSDDVIPYYTENEEIKDNSEEYRKIKEVQDKINSLPDTQIKIIEMVKANVDSVIKTQKYMIKVWDAIKSFNIHENKLGIEISLSAIAAVLFTIFIVEPLIVAEKRFLIKVRKESTTKVSVLMEIFKKDCWGNIALTMFLRNIYNALWFLTIIGGFIKIYEYKMIPYILAENPQIKPKEAFKISKEMMKNNKWKTFVLELSFIGWNLLSILTFGLLNLLYANPYKATTMTELYANLKENSKNNNPELYNKLKENNIFSNEEEIDENEVNINKGNIEKVVI